MARTIDVRGVACPGPVIEPRAAMAETHSEIVTIVDDEVAAHNVTRMAEKAGWRVRREMKTDGIYLHLAAEAVTPASEDAPAQAGAAPAGPTVLFVKSDRMGLGDDELGQVLIRGFFHALLELDEPPATIIFLNSGVKLAIDDSPVLDDLKELECRGVEILACGTCLNFFGLAERLRVGTISNMYTIVETLMAAGRVISP